VTAFFNMMQDESLSENWENLGNKSSGFSLPAGNGEENACDLSFLTVAADPLTPPRGKKEKVELQDIFTSDLLLVPTSTCTSPDDSSSKSKTFTTRRDLPTTQYEQVTYHGATGSLILTKDRIIFQSLQSSSLSSSSASSSTTTSSWRYRAIQKHQICQKENHHLLKLVSMQGDNKAVIFAFDRQDELERIRKDIAKRLKQLKRQQQHHHDPQDEDAATTATTVTTGFPSSGDLVMKHPTTMVLVDPIMEANNSDEPCAAPWNSHPVDQDLEDPLDKHEEKTTNCGWFQFRLFC
jgi:hypothetical protein